MTERYIAFDVETPNYANDRMSAIGVCVIEDGGIVDEFDSLVDPEARFDRFNIQLTGITPEAVQGAPTFPELWRELEPIFSSGVLIAHNAPFDLSVLSKCLLDYGVKWRRTVRYACTCQMGRRLLPGLENHKLDTMCDHFGLALDHHRAGSDSRACAELLLRYEEDGADIRSFLRTYDLLRRRQFSRQDRIRRVEEYERLFDEAMEHPDEETLRLLNDYYASGEWLEDYTADENGELPPGLKRGVLSQDALYDLLEGFEA